MGGSVWRLPDWAVDEPARIYSRALLDVAEAGADPAYTTKAANLSDIASPLTARINLGLGALAVLSSIATAQIDFAAVTYAKIQDISAASRLLGRGSAGGAGDVEEVTLGFGLGMSSASLAVAQTMAPTWTALHAFTATAGGMTMSGAPNLAHTYIGPSQKVGMLPALTAVSTTAPEGTAHFNIDSSVGSANLDAAYKTALTANADIRSGSANGWAASFVAQLYSPGTRRGGIALELDLNNFWGDYTGAAASPYAANLIITGMNTNGATGGYATFALGIQFAQNANPMWGRGIQFGPAGFNPFVLAAIEDISNSPTILRAEGSHTHGIDLTSATFSGAPFRSTGFAVNSAGAVSAGVWNGTDIAVADGGTGASTATAARTNLGFVDSTYTPTLTNVTNTSGRTAYLCHYEQKGSQVSVWFTCDLDPITTGLTSVGISLPVASDLASLQDLVGTIVAYGAGADAASGSVTADTANNRAQADFAATSTANARYVGMFRYRVL